MSGPFCEPPVSCDSSGREREIRDQKLLKNVIDVMSQESVDVVHFQT